MTILTPHLHSRKPINCMLLVVLLLLFHCYTTIYSVTAEHRCIHDSIAAEAGSPSTAVLMELPRRKRSGVQFLTICGSEWKPIRFSIFTEDMNNESRYCTAVGQVRSNFRGGAITCTKEHILTSSKRNIIVNQVLPRATKLHADRLLVEPMTNPIIVVPNDMPYICSNFTVPSSHRTKGVENADMVLYVAAGPTESGIRAWAIHCAELDNGRPIVGVTNLNPSKITSQEFFVRTATHEIAHALGFNIRSFALGGMVSTRTGVRGKPNVYMVVTPKVVEKTSAHYNCTNAPGMELEDEGRMGTVGSHWEMRNAKDELMAPSSEIGYYSALTMALFEDMGFYRANWTMAETMNWGRNAGCDFLEKKCVINGTTAYPNMFCTSSHDDVFVRSCTSDRLGLGRCQVKYHENPLPPEFQYFNDSLVGSPSFTLTDHCPVVLSYSDTKCADGLTSHMPGNRAGPSSRCLKGDNLHYGYLRIGDVCAEVRCNHGSVSVRHFGNETWHECHEGESIRLTGHLRGRIFCPKYSEVCYETGRDKSEIDLDPVGTGVIDSDIEQPRAVDLFLPGETKVYKVVGDEKCNLSVKSFDSPLLVSADGVMVALAEADSTYSYGANIGIAARYIGIEQMDWVEKAFASNGNNWETQLAMPEKEGQGDYYFTFEGSGAVGKGNKIYVLIISQKKDKQEWDSTRYVDWDFELVVGEVNSTSREQETKKTIEWKAPVTLSALTQKFKEQSVDVPQYGERYGFLTRDGRIVFVVKAFKKNRDFFLIIYSKDEGNEMEWEGTYVDVTGGCSYSSFFEWGGRLIMLPHCLGEMYKAKESNDMGKTWTNVIEPVAHIFNNLKGKLHFTTATIRNKTVLLFAEVKKKGLVLGPYRMYLWMTDGSCVRKIGLMTSIFDSYSVTSSGLLYTNGELFSIHPHSGPYPKRGIFLLRLKDGLERIKSVLDL